MNVSAHKGRPSRETAETICLLADVEIRFIKGAMRYHQSRLPS